VAALSTREAVDILNTRGQLRFRCLADVRKAPEIIAAAGPGLPIYTMFVHGDACSPIACRCNFTILLERADARRGADILRRAAAWERESLN